MKIEIIPYDVNHAYDIISKNVRDEDMRLSDLPDWDEWVKKWDTPGTAFTLIIDGKMIGCAGICVGRWKSGEAWTLLSQLFYKYKKTTFKAIKSGLDSIIKDRGLVRVEAWVYDGTEEICGNFLYHLGFRWEGKHRKKGPMGEDMHSYARIMGE